MNLTFLTDRCVWITGGSSGIGLELALLAAEAGARLGLLASRSEPLSAAADLCRKAGAKDVHVKVVDLGKEEETARATHSLLALLGVPDYLVLNAGVSQRALGGDTDLEVTRRLLSVNFMSPVVMTKIVLPSLLDRGEGRIGVTSSLTGIHGFPLRSSYAASKHALHGYFESLFLEYRHQGLSVTMGLGGRVHTAISTRALQGDGSRYQRMDASLQKGADPRRVARKYWKALYHGKREVLLGGLETITVLIRRCFPRLFFLLIGRAKAS